MKKCLIEPMVRFFQLVGLAVLLPAGIAYAGETSMKEEDPLKRFVVMVDSASAERLCPY